MLVTESAHTAGFHNQCGLSQGFPNPADGKSAQNVAVAHNQDVAGAAGSLWFPDDRLVIFLPDFVDQSIDSCNDVFGRLATRAPVTPDVPRR